MTSNGEFMLQEAIMRLAAEAPSPVIFDIGANVGKYSAGLLEKASSAGIVEKLELYSFEPNPKCVEAIKARIAPIPNSKACKVIEKIVTDAPGRASFYIAGETGGTSSLSAESQAVQGKKIEAECVTFDGFCQQNEITDVLFVKVDTEGNDMRVIQGAAEMLKSGGIHYLQFEYNFRWVFFRNFLKDVFDTVEPLGYRVAKVTSEGLEVYPEWQFELEASREGNYLIGKDFEALGLPLLKSAVLK